MVRTLGVLILASTALLAAEPAADDLRKRPITTDNGEVGKLLKKWYAEGAAAGNAGDFYDNRDGDHSPLDLRPWPQLQRFKYTPDDPMVRRHWAAARVVRPFVVFGNSSTSAPPTLSGSNVRSYYCNPRG